MELSEYCGLMWFPNLGVGISTKNSPNCARLHQPIGNPAFPDIVIISAKETPSIFFTAKGRIATGCYTFLQCFSDCIDQCNQSTRVVRWTKIDGVDFYVYIREQLNWSAATVWHAMATRDEVSTTNYPCINIILYQPHDQAYNYSVATTL